MQQRDTRSSCGVHENNENVMYIENITENKTTPKQKQINENVMHIRQNNENVMYIENIMIFDPINP